MSSISSRTSRMMTTRTTPPAALHPGRVCMSRIRERQAPQRRSPEMADRKANAYFRLALALAGVLVVPAIQAEHGDWEKKPEISHPFRIEMVDDETGRGVPLVELRTVNQIRYVTDSNGIATFDGPCLHLKPQASRHVRPGERKNHLFRGHLHGDLFREQGPDTQVRLQSGDVSARPDR